MNITGMSISEMVKCIKEGSLSSQELTSKYISNIEKNKHLNAVIEINPEAVEIAKRLDSLEKKEGALFGIPILVKDNINTGDKMRTSAGSVALANNIAPADAPIVLRLREAAAVILGKANTTEFANYMTTGAMPNGYSSRGGQTISFFDPKADPGGSSTGSGVAVAADMCAAAIGTETFGSIISPSQAAGITGIKPTIGLLSSEGIIPISFTLDTAGPMARCADDTRLLMEVLAGRKYQYDNTDKLKGVRIGICRMFTDEADPEWVERNEQLIEIMRQMGAECIDLPEHNIRIENHLDGVLKYEFKHGIDTYLKSMKNPAIPQNLHEIINYNELHPEIALKYGQDNLIDINETTSGIMDEPEYKEAMAARNTAISEFEKLFTDNCIDSFFALTGDSSLGAWAGFPCMTIPIGKTSSGLPIGSYFAAERFNEGVLLRIASEIEKHC